MPHRRPISALVAGCSLLAGLAAAPPAAAHADHYSQSAYVAVRPDGVHLDLDLSPGSLVAKQVVGSIDSDGDGSLSEAEQRTYASAVLHDLALEVDGRRQGLAVTTVDLPPVAHLTSGEAKLSLAFAGTETGLAPGPHTLTFRNSHAPVRSTHQAHALAGTPAITIEKLTRDATQEELTVNFTVAAAPGEEGKREPAGSPPFLFLGLVLGASVLLGAVSLRKA